MAATAVLEAFAASTLALVKTVLSELPLVGGKPSLNCSRLTGGRFELRGTARFEKKWLRACEV